MRPFNLGSERPYPNRDSKRRSRVDNSVFEASIIPAELLHQARCKLDVLSTDPTEPRGANPKVAEAPGWRPEFTAVCNSNYTINVIPADFAAEASNVIVLSHPALVEPRAIRQSAKSADPAL